MKPPIRWYGGKTTYAKWILQIMNRYEFSSYIEPFGGSGAVLFAKEPSKVEVYNDLYSDVVNMYEVIRDPKTFRKFKRFVALTPFSRQALHRSVNALSGSIDRIERAGHFFVWARQCFGGLSDNKKPGWSYSVTEKSKQSDAYLNVIERLEDVHRRLRSVQIENIDALDCIQRYCFRNEKGTSLVYADPPYVFATRKSTNNYRYELETVQHHRLVETLLCVPGHKILSGYESELYRPLLDAGWTVERKKTHVSCSLMRQFNGSEERKDRTECLYCSPIE